MSLSMKEKKEMNFFCRDFVAFTIFIDKIKYFTLYVEK